VARWAFIVWNFHPLLSAGFYRRTMNGFDLLYFYDFRNSTKIAVMFYLGSDAFTYLSSMAD